MNFHERLVIFLPIKCKQIKNIIKFDNDNEVKLAYLQIARYAEENNTETIKQKWHCYYSRRR